MKNTRRVILEIIEDDNGETHFNVEDIQIYTDGNGNVHSHVCKNMADAIGMFFKALFRNQNAKIHVLYEGLLSNIQTGIEIKTGFRSNIDIGSINNMLARIVYYEYVYLIRNPQNGLTKIGKTNNLDRRLSTIRREVNRNCYLLCDFRCIRVSAYQLEAKLHKTFTLMGLQVEGEWFNISDSLCLSLFSHVEGYTLYSKITKFILQLEDKKTPDKCQPQISQAPNLG